MLSIQELTSSTLKELHDELASARKEMVRVRVGIKTKHIKDLSLAGKQKKYIARIMTALKEFSLEEMVEKVAEVK